MGLLDRYAACKRKQQVVSSNESDPAPVQTVELSLSAIDGQPVTDGSSGTRQSSSPALPN